MPCCTHLVHFPGAAEYVEALLGHFLENHFRIVATYPGIREVEICVRMDKSWLPSVAAHRP